MQFISSMSGVVTLYTSGFVRSEKMWPACLSVRPSVRPSALSAECIGKER